MTIVKISTNDHERNANCQCAVCDKPTYRTPATIKSGPVYCSQACYGKSCRKEVPCIVCGNPIMAGLNKKTCSRECAMENNANLERIHSTGRKLNREGVINSRVSKKLLIEQRGSICEECGYDKVPVLNVHHIVERSKGGTNHESNLIVLCRNCHGEIHVGLRHINPRHGEM